MTFREFDWLLLCVLLGGVVSCTALALSPRLDVETACELSCAAHLLASVALVTIAPKILLA